MKACGKCGAELPLDAFPPNKNGKFGRHSQCRECHRARYERAKLIRAGLINPWVQSDALEMLAEMQARKERRLASFRRYRESRGAERQREYKKENAERLRARDSAYYQSHREDFRRRARESRARDPERARAASRAYRAANRERFRENGRMNEAKRRALKASTMVVQFTAEQLDARIAFYGGVCWICRAAPGEHLDHVKPLSRGGPHILANLRPACADCNRRKWALWPFSPEMLGANL